MDVVFSSGTSDLQCCDADLRAVTCQARRLHKGPRETREASMAPTKTTTSNATLSPEEEQELSRRWQKQADKRALASLIHAHLGLVIKIATEFRNSGPSMEDLIQEGH